MILTELQIRMMTYGPQEGQHVGKATFSGDAGVVTLNLNKHHLDEIFRTCADSIVETSKAAARHLTCQVIEHQRKIEEETRHAG
jgi:hypothetical protein